MSHGQRAHERRRSHGKSPWSSVALTLTTASALAASLLAGCGGSEAGPDADTHYDARAALLEAPEQEALPTPNGVLRLRLSNMLVGGPNLTICVSTLAGTGLSEAPGHMFGTVDASRGLDGTLPYPSVSPYIPLPTYAAPGFGYVVRLYARAHVPFSGLGASCPRAGEVSPVVEATVLAQDAAPRTTLVAMGVVEGAPVSCAADCPTPRMLVLADDPTSPASGARARVIHAIPNLPTAVHVCFDADFVSPTERGPLPAVRVLPTTGDTDGLAFGEATEFVDVPALSSTPGAFFVHLNAPGAPDCFSATLALGPITLPFAVPDTAPSDVARTIDDGDVLSLFAYGRLGNPCANDTACAVVPGSCDTARGVCVDALSPSILPWQDVMGM